MRFLKLPDKPIDLPRTSSLPAAAHVFEADDVEAVNAALAAERPLLLYGEPGTGKSQLARAVAKALRPERAFLTFTVDARTEPRDLLYEFDAVARLAEAQVQRVVSTDADAIRVALSPKRFVVPGTLWWALNAGGADQHLKDDEVIAPGATAPETPKGWVAKDGTVLLIDEIDKADTAVPNGLLESLGLGRFDAPGGLSVSHQEGTPFPLIVITTNGERALPDAFLRRCLVHTLTFPSHEQLLARGRAHFSELDERPAADKPSVLEVAAQLILDDRQAVKDRPSKPGCAEYLDLLRAVRALEVTTEARIERLDKIKGFALDKHPVEPAW